MDNINIDKVDNRQQHHYVPDEKDDTDWCVVQAETGGQHVWHQDYGYWCVMVKHGRWVKSICIF